MVLNVLQQDLAEGLRTVVRAVSPRGTMPVLSGVHIRASRTGLILRATDLELAIATRVEARVEQEGELVLPGRYLHELVRRLPPGPLSLRVDPRNATAELGAPCGDYLVHGFAPDQFPAMPPESGSERLTIAVEALRTMLRETGFAASHDESRPWFTGVFVGVKGARLTATATDGAIVALSEQQVENPQELSFSVILPGRSVAELARLLGESSAAICQVSPHHNQLHFQVGEVAVTTRLLEGQYPDVRRVLPRGYSSAVVGSRQALLSAAERAALSARESAILLEGTVGGLVVTSQAPEVGRVTERVAGALEGEPFAIPLNVRYLLEGLKTLEGDTLLLEYSGPRTPIRCRSRRESASCFALLPLVSF